MQALAKKYGVDKPFTDNQLFNEIVAMTYSEVGDFIKTHVQGETPIPYKRFLEKAGVTIVDTDQKLPSIIMVTPTTTLYCAATQRSWNHGFSGNKIKQSP